MTSDSLLVLWRKGRFQVLSLLPACGSVEATPHPIGSQGLCLGKTLSNSCLLLVPMGTWYWKGSCNLGCGNKALRNKQTYVSLCVFCVNANNRWEFPTWGLDMRWEGNHCRDFLESVLRIVLFLEGKAVYDLSHFLLKLFDYFLLILLMWTLSIQQEGISNNFLCSAPSPLLLS